MSSRPGISVTSCFRAKLFRRVLPKYTSLTIDDSHSIFVKCNKSAALSSFDTHGEVDIYIPLKNHLLLPFPPEHATVEPWKNWKRFFCKIHNSDLLYYFLGRLSTKSCLGNRNSLLLFVLSPQIYPKGLLFPRGKQEPFFSFTIQFTSWLTFFCGVRPGSRRCCGAFSHCRNCVCG